MRKFSIFLLIATTCIVSSVAVMDVAGKETVADTSRNLHLRGSLRNSRLRFEDSKSGNVAFMGGSITEMNGYRPMVATDLQRQFPDTKFNFINAGISSTCSTTGAFRLERDILSKGPIDLLLVEFAVNDDQDGEHASQECLRGMEGILRHCRTANPMMDIVVVYFCNPRMVELLSEGKMPVSIAAHDKAASYYEVSSVNLAREVAQQIDEGRLDWKTYGGTHPAAAGNRLAANMVKNLLQKAWNTPLEAESELAKHASPERPLDAYSYFDGSFVSPSSADYGEAWSWHVPNWKGIPGSFRSTFAGERLLTSTTPNVELKLDFQGRAIGAYVLAGPDAGIVEASIDGGAFTSIDLYHRFSRGLHYPRSVMFATGLDDAKHTLRLRIAGDQKEGRGYAARILQFTVNGRD